MNISVMPLDSQMSPRDRGKVQQSSGQRHFLVLWVSAAISQRTFCHGVFPFVPWSDPIETRLDQLNFLSSMKIFLLHLGNGIWTCFYSLL